MKTNKIILNGKTVDAVVFGDGQKQIDLFNTVSAHIKEHGLKLETSDNITAKIKGMQGRMIIGNNDKYEIRVIEEKFPGIKTVFHKPRYFMAIRDKTTFEPAMYYGTIAHCFWDLLNKSKEMQK